MRLKYPRQIIIILSFLFLSLDARAQVPEEVSSMPDQWELSLDGIKSKAQSLMVENNGLQVEYDQLTERSQELQQSIDDQQDKNDRMDRFLKDRHGRTDQQLRIDQLTNGIRAEKQELRAVEDQMENWKRKQSDLDQKIQQLKQMVSKLELQQQAEKQKAQSVPTKVQPQVDGQLTQLRKQMEDESKQEVLLANELQDLKTGDKTKNLNVDAIDEQNKQLEAHLDVLQLQKLQHLKAALDSKSAEDNGQVYAQLKERKDELESKINVYELRMDELRQSSLEALSWSLKKKKLVHEMVQADARNNQIRDKVKVLREDIDVLKGQVAKLERRVDFAQDQVAKQ